MAQFYGSLQGSRGEATRQGTARSGLTGHIRGWNVGCRVVMDEINGKDVCRIYLTSGSNGRTSDKLLGTFTEEDLSKEIKVTLKKPRKNPNRI